MSETGLNCGFPPGQPDAADMPVSAPSALTQAGSVKRLINSGTASLKMACLSAISTELSIMNKRSTLSVWVTMGPVGAIDGSPPAPAFEPAAPPACVPALSPAAAPPAALPPREPAPLPTLDSPASEISGGCDCVL